MLQKSADKSTGEIKVYISSQTVSVLMRIVCCHENALVALYSSFGT